MYLLQRSFFAEQKSASDLRHIQIILITDFIFQKTMSNRLFIDCPCDQFLQFFIGSAGTHGNLQIITGIILKTGFQKAL